MWAGLDWSLFVLSIQFLEFWPGLLTSFSKLLMTLLQPLMNLLQVQVWGKVVLETNIGTLVGQVVILVFRGIGCTHVEYHFSWDKWIFFPILKFFVWPKVDNDCSACFSEVVLKIWASKSLSVEWGLECDLVSWFHWQICTDSDF